MRCLLFLLPFLAYGQNISGLWDATVIADGLKVPFQMKIEQHGSEAVATFFDGPLTYPSDSGVFRDGKLHAHWNIYNANLDVALTDGELKGTYLTQRSNTKILHKEIIARPAAAVEPDPHPAQLAGHWVLQADNKDPKLVWKVEIAQKGDKISGAIQRLDGDSGTLTGTIKNGQVVLSHFSGIRPAVLRGEVLPDGGLKLTYNEQTPMHGYPEPKASKMGVAPVDPGNFTSLKEPQKPLAFAFADVNGKLISNTDPQFQGKVLLVNITGSWCPNCNDDAPFLEKLYRSYHTRGLEIVGLSFESGDLDYDRERVKEFIARNGVTYPVLIAGTTDNVAEKLPSVMNFAGFPTTFFAGRDGLVKSIHDGFSGAGTGQAHEELKREIEALVKQLLKQGA